MGKFLDHYNSGTISRGKTAEIVITTKEKLKTISATTLSQLSEKLQTEEENNWFPCEHHQTRMAKCQITGYTQRLIYGTKLETLPKVYGQKVKPLK